MNEAEMQQESTDSNSTSPKVVRKFDLEERTALYGEAVIAFLKTIAPSSITIPLIKQLVRCATSVGANYCEADDGVSRSDFRHRISICQREARETKYWLRMIAAAVPTKRDEARTLWREAHELYLIFSTIRRKTKPAK